MNLPTSKLKQLPPKGDSNSQSHQTSVVRIPQEPVNKPSAHKPVQVVQQIDLSAILKQMSKDQIKQLLSDPEVADLLQVS